MGDTPLQFIEDSLDAQPELTIDDGWDVLVVDDDRAVHDVTLLALRDFRYQGLPLRFHHAFSAAEAIKQLDPDSKICLILLDIVMESDEAGFDVVRHVREAMQNRNLRIILRTGQPGQAPPREVVQRYDINDYHNKADFSADKMFISIYTALAMHSQLLEHTRYERKLTAAYRDIEQLVFIASHDLQEPLRSVSSLCKRLQKMDDSALDETARRCIEFIFDGVGHMNELVTDLLDYSRIGEAQPVRTFEIKPLIDELQSDLSALIESSGASITCSGEKAISAQRIKIKMLLQNLISNSIKFRQPDTQPRIEIHVDGQQNDAIIRVHDNGVGIPSQFHDQIFKVFQRLDDKDKSSGTGIGLAHCKRIMDIHGGTIEVESTPGVGTTISCYLPGART